jgi:hypothetical protein
MRRIERVVGALLLASVAAAASAPGAFAADLSDFEITITPETEGRAVMVGGPHGHAGRTVGYWGQFSGDRSGSYRATCVWLADPNAVPRDSRVMCTIVLSFRAGPGGAGTPNGGTLVAQGLMLRPEGKRNLFTRGSRRPTPSTPLPRRTLPITGASGYFRGQQGVIAIVAPTRVWIDFGASAA